jgi:Chaperone of endosialidase
VIRSNHRNRATLGVVLLAAVLCLSAVPLAAADLAAVNRSANGVDFSLQMEVGSVTLTVTGPAGFAYQRRFGAGESPSISLFDERGNPLADGSYAFELRATPTRAELRSRLDEAQIGGAPARNDDRYVQSGSFSVLDGRIVSDSAEEPGAQAGGAHLSARDQVIADDVIIQDSLCVGVDCVNNENFGFDTIRLKENNLRIKFEDTSVGSFPTNDWELTANDSASGGVSRFSITDVDGGKTPFTIRAGAKTNSIFVDSSGRLGLKTGTPVVDIHTVSGNTPTLRLEQDGSSGFSAQTWDVAGNETVFFVRDVTSGSKLPFKITPGAPTNSLFIGSTGHIGINAGTSPSANVDIREAGNAATGDVHLLVENTNSTTLARTIMKLSNNGNTFFDMENRNAHTWRINSTNLNYLEFDDQNDAGTEFQLRPNGELYLEGALVTTSTRDAKKDIVPVDTQAIYARLKALPIATWSYKQDPSTVVHLGPMAEDFYDAFGLGSTNKGISVLDASTVALAAIQGLDHTVGSEIEALRQENAQLKQRLAALEARLGATP